MEIKILCVHIPVCLDLKAPPLPCNGHAPGLEWASSLPYLQQDCRALHPVKHIPQVFQPLYLSLPQQKPAGGKVGFYMEDCFRQHKGNPAAAGDAG